MQFFCLYIVWQVCSCTEIGKVLLVLTYVLKLDQTHKSPKYSQFLVQSKICKLVVFAALLKYLKCIVNRLHLQTFSIIKLPWDQVSSERIFEIKLNESQYFRISLWPSRGFIKVYKTLIRHHREVWKQKN